MIKNVESPDKVKISQNSPFTVIRPQGAYMPHDDDMASITYTVKELLSDIRGSLGRLEGKLDAKADRSEVIDLIHRIEEESRRITTIETHITTQKQISDDTREWHRFVWPCIASIALVALAVLTWLDPMK
jgi:hypothetical protein